MKHLKNINEYLSNINEGINYNAAKDADLVDIGSALLAGSGKTSDEASDEDLSKIAEEKLKEAKPFALTGKVKEDFPKLIKYITDEFKRCKIDLDVDNASISREMSGGDNMIEIPIKGLEDYYFCTTLDYLELASNQGPNRNIVLSGVFCSEDDGTLDFDIADIGNSGDVMKACTEFNKYIENIQ
jgi:hypothetical protein